MVAWGSGSPFREFLYSDDMADACVFLMSLSDSRLSGIFNLDYPPLVNIGCGKDLTIRQLVALIQKVVGFNGTVEWDNTKPDGTPRKLLDVSRIKSLGWCPETELAEGVRAAYTDYRNSLQ
jgi:GDP-L-fucose synthase